MSCVHGPRSGQRASSSGLGFRVSGTRNTTNPAWPQGAVNLGNYGVKVHCSRPIYVHSMKLDVTLLQLYHFITVGVPLSHIQGAKLRD